MMSRLLKTFALLGLITCASGCVASRTVVIDSASDVVRLGPGVKGPGYIWRNGGWERVPKMKYPEGWYAGPGPK